MRAQKNPQGVLQTSTADKGGGGQSDFKSTANVTSHKKAGDKVREVKKMSFECTSDITVTRKGK